VEVEIQSLFGLMASLVAMCLTITTGHWARSDSSFLSDGSEVPILNNVLGVLRLIKAIPSKTATSGITIVALAHPQEPLLVKVRFWSKYESCEGYGTTE
jgi:hypothetical protein